MMNRVVFMVFYLERSNMFELSLQSYIYILNNGYFPTDFDRK